MSTSLPVYDTETVSYIYPCNPHVVPVEQNTHHLLHPETVDHAPTSGRLLPRPPLLPAQTVSPIHTFALDRGHPLHPGSSLWTNVAAPAILGVLRDQLGSLWLDRGNVLHIRCVRRSQRIWTQGEGWDWEAYLQRILADPGRREQEQDESDDDDDDDDDDDGDDTMDEDEDKENCPPQSQSHVEFHANSVFLRPEDPPDPDPLNQWKNTKTTILIVVAATEPLTPDEILIWKSTLQKISNIFLKLRGMAGHEQQRLGSGDGGHHGGGGGGGASPGQGNGTGTVPDSAFKLEEDIWVELMLWDHELEGGMDWGL